MGNTGCVVEGREMGNASLNRAQVPPERATATRRALNTEVARKQVLPTGVLPRGLSRTEAARYVGVSPVTLDRMVKDGLMPKPVRIYGRVVWDARAIDQAFDALDGASAEADNQWGKMAV